MVGTRHQMEGEADGEGQERREGGRREAQGQMQVGFRIVRVISRAAMGNLLMRCEIYQSTGEYVAVALRGGVAAPVVPVLFPELPWWRRSRCSCRRVFAGAPCSPYFFVCGALVCPLGVQWESHFSVYDN